MQKSCQSTSMISRPRPFSAMALLLLLSAWLVICVPTGTLAFSQLQQGKASTGRVSVAQVAMQQNANTDSFADRTMDRRSWLAAVPLATGVSTFLLGLSSPGQAAAAAEKLSIFNDPTHGFSMQVPADWKSSVQMLRDRRELRIWLDPSDASGKTGLFIAYTPIRDDFTSLGSFGTVDQVAAQTILPKGEIAGFEGVEAKMLSAKSEKQAYFFDYVQKVAPVQQEYTHFRTIFSLAQGATGGAGAVLVTITVQAPEERYKSEMQPLFDTMIGSYGKALANQT